MGHGEKGDLHDIEASSAIKMIPIIMKLLFVTEYPIKGQVNLEKLIVKAWMVVKKKLMMTKMICYLETQWVDHVDPGDLGVVVDWKDSRNHRTSGSCLYELASQMPNLFSKG